MDNIFEKVALSNISIAIDTIDSITNNMMFQELQLSITTSIHNAVHAIVDYYERVAKVTLAPDEDDLFRAFMYVNNQLKHDNNLQFITYNVSGNMFPLFFPARFGPPGVFWADFKDNGRTQARGKRKHYEQTLMNKDVKKTLELVKTIICGLTVQGSSKETTP